MSTAGFWASRCHDPHLQPLKLACLVPPGLDPRVFLDPGPPRPGAEAEGGRGRWFSRLGIGFDGGVAGLVAQQSVLTSESGAFVVGDRGLAEVSGRC